jgi:hypothetical protein
MTKVRTSVEGERFLHKDLWRVVERQLEHATAIPRGAFYDDLVAMVFALLALEAYLNFVGERIAPEIWKDEREFFRKEPYRGFDGKLRKILELVGIMEPARDVRPYSTVWLLKDLRDLIAHAKLMRFGSVIEHTADEEPSMFYSPLRDVITHENAEGARDDIKAFIETIHAAAIPKVGDIWFGPAAFGGTVQYSSSHGTLAT